MKLDFYKTDPLYLIERQLISSKRILAESCQGLTKEQILVVENVYNHFTPLIEATLNAQQIGQVFGEVEKASSASGDNKTAVGKAAGAVGTAAKGGAEAVKKANEILNKAGTWLKNTTPVQNFDQKFNDLKQQVTDKLGGEDSKIVQQVQKLGQLAKDNPGKTAAIIGVLTVLAGLAAGPVGGMVAGQVLRGASELIQGADLSTALGKGLKTAALGATIGAVSDFMQDALGSYVSTEGTFYVNGQEVSQEEYSQHMKSKGFADPMNPTADELQKATGKQIPDTVKSQTSQQSGFPQLKSGGFADTVQQTSDAQRSAKGLIGSGLKGESAIKQRPVIEEEILYNLRPLSESMVSILFKRVAMTNHRMISEGVIWEQGQEPEGQKPSFMQKVMGKASEFGKNLTTKVTASKLMSAWKKLGKDSAEANEVKDFLVQQGVNDQVITQTFKDMRLPITGNNNQATDKVDVTSIKQMIAKLPVDRKIRLISYLKKDLKVS